VICSGGVHQPGTIGPYRINDTIATGGMGVVYRAQHVDTGEVVALKTVAGLRPGMVGSMRREILALVRVRHPGVVRLVGEGLHEGLPWHAMELLDGRPLRNFIDGAWKPYQPALELMTTRDNGQLMTTAPDILRTISERRGAAPPPIPPHQRLPAGGSALRESLSLVRRICQTLAFLHGEGIVHGDIKPENVVLQAGDKKPVLVDFGIMRRVAGATGREALEVDHDGAGTLAYMAPEQILAGDLDARADLYAVGCILYEMVCGRPPFLDDWNGSIYEQQLESAPRPPSETVSGLPERLEALILRLLAKEPQQRPGYADDVGSELEALGAEPWPEFSDPAPRSYLYRPGFSGRMALLRQLDGELEAARERAGRCAVLTGPSGSGKTRLCMELARRARAAGMRALSGECLPLGTGDAGAGLPLQAFRPLLQAVADRCRSDGPEATEHLLGDHARVLVEFEPQLARVPGYERLAAPPKLPSERIAERVQRSVVEVLERFAERQPLLIVLDDLQWADDLTMGVVRSLLARGGELRALLLITLRSESADAALNAVRNAAGALRLRLDPLGRGEVESIIAGMTARDDPPPSLVGHLAHESGGNPFFVAEYLKAAVADGLLQRVAGHWEFRLAHAAASSLLAPGSVQALVARRFDGLSDEAQTAVAMGAVLGRSFPADELQAGAELEAERFEAAVDELLTRQILVIEESGPLRFVHDKIRESAYAAIDENTRRRLHARAAELLLKSADNPDVWHRVAHHFLFAGDDARAFEWAERAGVRACATAAYREAREHLEVACRLAPKLAPLELARLHRLYAEALDGVGAIDASGQELKAALAALGRPLPQSRPGWLAMLAGQTLRQVVHRFLPPPSPRGDEERVEAAIAAGRLVGYYFFRNQMMELLASVTLATNLSEASGADVPHARSAVFLGGMVGVMGLNRAALGYFTRARESARRSGDLLTEMFQAQVEGMYHLHRADWVAARGVIEPALERCTAAGVAFETEALLLPASLMALFTGDFDAAEGYALRMRQSARTLSHRLHDTWAAILLAECHLRRARPDDAVAEASAPLDELEREGDIVNRLNCLGLIAGARLMQGKLDEALALAAQTEQLVTSHPSAGMGSYHLHEYVPAVRLAAWARALERGERANDLAQQARQSVRRAHRYARIAEIARPFALRHEARRRALLGQAQRARRLLEESAQVARARGLRWDAAAADSQLGGGER
jgi:serine/threonine protein kinase